MSAPGQLDLAGVPTQLKAWSQYFTPPRLAERVAGWANLRGVRVLEPSAGSGNLVRAALDAGAREVVALEVDPRWVTHLRERFAGQPVVVRHVDALEELHAMRASGGDYFTIALCNVPYEEDTAHLEAILGVCDRMRAVLNATALHGRAKWNRVWSQFPPSRVAHLVTRPKFGEKGGQRDIVAVKAGRARSSCVTEWWTEETWS